MPFYTPLFIDGKEVPSSPGNDTFEVRNPATGQVVGISASANSADCKAAIESAARAFKAWERTSIAQRRDVFLKAADLAATDKYKQKIMTVMREETATVDYWCYYNWVGCSNSLRVTASMFNQLKGETFPSTVVPGGRVETHKRALGVILGIAPWNAPVTLALRAVAVPILCGNTVILKSSEYSPRSQSIVVELFHEAGLPKGVLNFLSMSRETAPALTAEIIAHPAVRKINFTGSDRVGRIIATEAAKYLKPCVFELGGNAPVIVLDDANVVDAARAIVQGSMAHSGQICMSTERVIVQRAISSKLIAEVHNLCKGLKAGNLDEDATANMSALFTEGSAENVLSMVREAQSEGATLVLGDLTRQGAVVQPHLLTDVKPGMKIWDRETFGPVAVFTVVDTVDEAVEMANSSEYSLTSGVWTMDLYKAQDVAARLNAGYTNINGMTVHSEPLAGLVGLGGASGYGRFDLNSFTETRVVVTHPVGERSYPLLMRN